MKKLKNTESAQPCSYLIQLRVLSFTLAPLHVSLCVPPPSGDAEAVPPHRKGVGQLQA